MLKKILINFWAWAKKANCFQSTRKNYQVIAGNCHCIQVSVPIGSFFYLYREVNSLTKRVEKFFQTCYEKDLQDVANLFFYSVKRTQRFYCLNGKKNSKKLNRLLTVSDCYNKYLKDDDKCLVKFINETKQLINYDLHNVKIPHTCW